MMPLLFSCTLWKLRTIAVTHHSLVSLLIPVLIKDFLLSPLDGETAREHIHR